LKQQNGKNEAGGGHMPDNIVQTIFQKKLFDLSKISFWIWIGTLSVFVGLVFMTRNPDNLKLMPDWLFLGNIGLGVVAFIVAILSRFVSTPRTLEETKSIYKTLSIGVGALALLVLLGFISPDEGNVRSARLNGSPLPDITLTANKTTTKTPSPSTIQSQQYKPKANQIDCIGPDYKTFKTTPDACAKFRTDWGLPASATPWPTSNHQTNNQNKTPNEYTYATPSYPPCTIYYPALGYSQTYYYTSPEQCRINQNSVNMTTSVPPEIANRTYSPMPTLSPITFSPLPTIQPEPTSQNCYWKVNNYGAQFYYCQ